MQSYNETLPLGILLDIDGTLTNSDREVSLRTKEALLAVRANDIPCGVCTGRHFAAIKNYILPCFAPDSLHITAGGGQLVRASGEVVWESLISVALIAQIVTNVEALGGGVIYGSGDYLYASVQSVAKLASHPWGIAVKPISEGQRQELTSSLVSVVNLNPEIRDYIATLSVLTIKLMGEDPKSQYFDLTAAGVNKATSAVIWCEKQGIGLDRLMAVGDNANDEELLKAAGMSVAMGNGTKRVKQIAREVIGTADEDGLANYLFKVLGL